MRNHPAFFITGKSNMPKDGLTMTPRSKPPKGVIHHSDRSAQYASHDSVEALLQHGFPISIAGKGNPYDNATTESFFKTLKVEKVYLWEYRTLEDVQIRLPFFIQEFYHRKRPHSSPGYKPPVESKELFL